MKVPEGTREACKRSHCCLGMGYCVVHGLPACSPVRLGSISVFSCLHGIKESREGAAFPKGLQQCGRDDLGQRGMHQ